MAKKGKFKGRPGGEKAPAGKPKEKKHNPFEIHINRVKHDVVGRKSKLDRGLPGVSRAKAVKKVSSVSLVRSLVSIAFNIHASQFLRLVKLLHSHHLLNMIVNQDLLS